MKCSSTFNSSSLLAWTSTNTFQYLQTTMLNWKHTMFSQVSCRAVKYLGFCYCLLDFIVFFFPCKQKLNGFVLWHFLALNSFCLPNPFIIFLAIFSVSLYLLLLCIFCFFLHKENSLPVFPPIPSFSFRIWVTSWAFSPSQLPYCLHVFSAQK